jgi:hypothetical protein
MRPLPELLLLDDHGGSWDTYLEAVYRAYCEDWVFGAPATFQGKSIRCKQSPSHVGKEYAFWHLTSVDEKNGDRVPDLRRCERIRWIRHVIAHADSEHARVWRSDRHEERYLVALDDFSYVAVLGRRTGYFLLVTAYYVEYPHRRRKLEKDYRTNGKKN